MRRIFRNKWLWQSHFLKSFFVQTWFRIMKISTENQIWPFLTAPNKRSYIYQNLFEYVVHMDASLWNSSTVIMAENSSKIKKRKLQRLNREKQGFETKLQIRELSNRGQQGSPVLTYLLTYVLTLTNKVTYFQLLYSQRRPFKQINYRHIITTQKHLHAYSFQITFKSSSLNTVLQNTKLTRYMHFIFLWSRPFKQTNKQTDSERIII